MDDLMTNLLILVSVGIGFLWTLVFYQQTMAISTELTKKEEEGQLLNNADGAEAVASKNEGKMTEEEYEEWAKNKTTAEIQTQMDTVSAAIEKGANTFLTTEYTYMGFFIVGFGAILFAFLGLGSGWQRATWTTVAFVVGSVSSIACGWIGMKIAVKANVRTAAAAFRCAPNDLAEPFVAAFKAGGVMGFSLCGIAIINLWILVMIYSLYIFTTAFTDASPASAQLMYECVAGYGLGGSSIALFGRVGGGIYTKAADVGADQVKLDGLREDDPRNPAVIADNVGDNVGDVAGMGADLFGSFAESSCAAMIVSATSADLHSNWAAMCFPMLVGSCGLLVSALTTIPAITTDTPHKDQEVVSTLKKQLGYSTALMTPAAYFIAHWVFPETFAVSVVDACTPNGIFLCVASGLWSGLFIGLATEYYTSDHNAPVQELAHNSKQAANNIIYGLALGYKSVIIPVFCLAFTIYLSYSLAGMYGVACGAIGILSTLAIGLTIDAYGPICDNAGGIAEMSWMPHDVRETKTDPLDAAGNTTAAIGKGFAIGSAAMVSLALFGAFVTVKLPAGQTPDVNVLDPIVFAGVLVGAMMPYWFSAMTMKSVGHAANQMSEEVYRQFDKLKLLENPDAEPNYENCVAISTEASLREMIPPGILVMVTPLVTGYLFGPRALAGLLVGILTSGVQVAISASNSGGAWDNAKKHISAGNLKPLKDGTMRNKNTDWHRSSIIGDTVGDPLKDTSGPSINILVKLSAITSLVFASSMPGWDEEGYLVRQFLN
jgi:inorganic pyrophosphatase